MTFEPTPMSNPSALKPSLRFILLLVLIGLAGLFAHLTDTAAAQTANSVAVQGLSRTTTGAMPAHASAAPNGADAWNGDHIDWMSFDAGLAEAQRTNKPVFLQVHATWCGYCKQLRRQFNDPEIVGLSKGFVMVLLDIDEAPQIAAAYRHDGTYVPRSMILTQRGHLVARIDNNRRDHIYAISGRSPRGLRSVMIEAQAYFSSNQNAQVNWPGVWRGN